MLGAERKEARLRYLQEYCKSKLRTNPNIMVNTPKENFRTCGIANVGLKNMPPKDLAIKLMGSLPNFYGGHRLCQCSRM